MNKPMIYTCGYTGTKLAHWEGAAAKLALTVIDTRINPISRNPVWNTANLQAALGIRYVHVPQLGNRNYKNGGAIAIVDLTTGLKQVTPYLKTGRSVLLMCACTHHETCHRSVVAAALSEATGCEVVHWNTDDLRNIGEAVTPKAAEGMPLQLVMNGF